MANCYTMCVKMRIWSATPFYMERQTLNKWRKFVDHSADFNQT